MKRQTLLTNEGGQAGGSKILVLTNENKDTIDEK